MVAAGFTSTVMAPVLEHEDAIIDEDLVLYDRIKKKGYVRLLTNKGPLNLEVFCDVLPKTCENFLKLCASGYYDGTKFHRSIRNFMVGFDWGIKVFENKSYSNADSRRRPYWNRPWWQIYLGNAIQR